MLHYRVQTSLFDVISLSNTYLPSCSSSSGLGNFLVERERERLHHKICRSRLARAARIAIQDLVLVLLGWLVAGWVSSVSSGVKLSKILVSSICNKTLGECRVTTTTAPLFNIQTAGMFSYSNCLTQILHYNIASAAANQLVCCRSSHCSQSWTVER